MNNSTNGSMDHQDYLDLLGKLNDKELRYVLPSIVWLLLVSLLGIPGNIFTICFYKTGFLKSTYKLLIFNITVASVDMLSCSVAIPLEIFILFSGYAQDDRHEFVCKLSRFSNFFMTYTSGFILTLIAVERYIKICRSFKSQLNFIFARKLCTAAVVLGIIVTWPSAFVFGKKTLKTVVNGLEIKVFDCSISDNASSSKAGFVYLVIMFLLAIVCITLDIVLYSSIGFKIKRQSLRLSKEARMSSAGVGIANEGTVSITDNHYSTETYSIRTETISEVVLENVDRNKTSCIKSQEEIKPRKSYSIKRCPPKTLNRDRANQTSRALFIITAIYVVSYIPNLTILTIESVVKGFYEDKTFTERAVSNFFVRLYFLNCGVNHFVYALCDSKLRYAIKRMFSSLKLRLCK